MLFERTIKKEEKEVIEIHTPLFKHQYGVYYYLNTDGVLIIAVSQVDWATIRVVKPSTAAGYQDEVNRMLQYETISSEQFWLVYHQALNAIEGALLTKS